MRPTKRHMKVDRYVEPAEFDEWKRIAESMGFLYVASGPLVRSSYKVRRDICVCVKNLLTDVLKAGELFIENVLKGKGAQKQTLPLVAEDVQSKSTLSES